MRGGIGKILYHRAFHSKFTLQGGDEVSTSKSSKIERWIVLFVVALVGGIITKLPYIKDSYYSALTASMGITNTQFAFLLTAYGIMNTIVYIPGGFLADRVSPKLLVIISCFGTGLAGIWYSFLPSYGYLVAIHAIFGITTVFTFWAAMVKITNNLGKGEEQGKMFGLLEGGRGLIGTLVALGSVAVFERFADEVAGVKGIIMYYSIAMMIAGVLSIIFLKDPAKVGTVEDDGTKLKWSDFKIVMKIPRVWLCGLVVACNYTAVILFGYITPYLVDVYGMSNSGAAVLGIFRSYVLMFAASLVAGAIADKMKSVIKFWCYGYIGMGVFSFLYLLIPVNRSLLWIVVINFVLHGMFLLAVKALYFAPIDEMHIDKKLAGTASGIISIVGYAPEMFGYTLAGSILDKNPGVAGYNLIFIATGIFSVIGVISVFLLKKSNDNYGKKLAQKK